MTHNEFVESLRALADFYEAHPGLSAAYSLTGDLLSIFPSGKQELAECARLMGNSLKSSDDTFFYITREEKIGSFILRALEYRTNVCERVVVGTEHVPEQAIEAMIIPAHEREIVEWRCPEAILSE